MRLLDRPRQHHDFAGTARAERKPARGRADAGQRPQLTSATANQIGYYRPTGSVETASSPVANNVALLAEAAVLNYLALHNRVGDFATVLPMNGLGSGTAFQSLIAFQPIV